MEKKMENYLHLYLGCECICTQKEGIFKLVGITDKAFLEGNWDGILENSNLKAVPFSDIKLALRPSSDMTEGEKNVYQYFQADNGGELSISGKACGTQYLLFIGIDLFELIKAGLAIDKTKLATNS